MMHHLVYSPNLAMFGDAHGKRSTFVSNGRRSGIVVMLRGKDQELTSFLLDEEAVTVLRDMLTEWLDTEVIDSDPMVGPYEQWIDS